jgi:hypothetical protein
VIDLEDTVESSQNPIDLVRTYHTLVSGREDYHPSPATELRMGIPSDPALKPRVWFVYGEHPHATRPITAWDPDLKLLKDILIAGDTEIHPHHSLARWVKAKIGAIPAHGSVGFPINPPVLRTELEYNM